MTIDATTGSNPISNTNSYFNFNPSSQPIYYRITDTTTSEYAFGYFEIVVNNSPIFNNLPNLSVCDIDSNTQNGITNVDLTTQTPIILTQQILSPSYYSVTYHTSMSNAEAGVLPILNPTSFSGNDGITIWARCETVTTGCYFVDSFQLEINTPLFVTTPQPINMCDNDSTPNNQFTTFDLTVRIPQILDGTTNHIVTFYPSLTDALNNTNEITNPSNYTNIAVTIQTLGVKITNSTTGCISFTTLNIRVLPIPYINHNLNDFMSCDIDSVNDGTMFYNNNSLGLIDYVDDILGPDQVSLGYTVHFYTNIDDAQNNNTVNAISNLSTYQVQTGTYYVTVTNYYNECFAVGSFNVVIEQLPEPNITSNSNIACINWNETLLSNNLVLNSNLTSTGHNFYWYKDGDAIANANNATLPIINMSEPSSEYSVIATKTSMLGCASNNANFTVIRSGIAIPSNETGYVITNLSGVQNIIITVAGFGIYHFQLDNNLPQDSPVFENVSIGTHTISVIDDNGCGNLTLTVEITELLVPAPNGLSSQTFTEGQTLEDIIVNGENIQWYSSANGTIPLSLNTPLVNGITYYATQIINGIESTARLAVTVTVQLSISENELLTVLLAPNPVKNKFHIQSQTILKTVMLYNLLGQKILEQHFNDTQLSIDITTLTSGSYILKVYSDVGQKTLRIIKE